MADNDILNIGSMIREMRIARGMTQTDLGKLVGVTKARISSIESNANNITLIRIVNIMRVLGYSLTFEITTRKTFSDNFKLHELESMFEDWYWIKKQQDLTFKKDYNQFIADIDNLFVDGIPENKAEYYGDYRNFSKWYKLPKFRDNNAG